MGAVSRCCHSILEQTAFVSSFYRPHHPALSVHVFVTDWGNFSSRSLAEKDAFNNNNLTTKNLQCLFKMWGEFIHFDQELGSEQQLKSSFSNSNLEHSLPSNHHNSNSHALRGLKFSYNTAWNIYVAPCSMLDKFIRWCYSTPSFQNLYKWSTQ